MRVSTDEQASKGRGLAIQRRAIEGYCKKQGLLLMDVLSDEGVSGANGLDTRDGLATALARIERHKAGVLVYRFDRLARQLLVQLITAERSHGSRTGARARGGYLRAGVFSAALSSPVAACTPSQRTGDIAGRAQGESGRAHARAVGRSGRGRSRRAHTDTARFLRAVRIEDGGERRDSNRAELPGVHGSGPSSARRATERLRMIMQRRRNGESSWRPESFPNAEACSAIRMVG